MLSPTLSPQTVHNKAMAAVHFCITCAAESFFGSPSEVPPEFGFGIQPDQVTKQHFLQFLHGLSQRDTDLELVMACIDQVGVRPGADRIAHPYEQQVYTAALAYAAHLYRFFS